MIVTASCLRRQSTHPGPPPPPASTRCDAARATACPCGPPGRLTMGLSFSRPTPGSVTLHDGAGGHAIAPTESLMNHMAWRGRAAIGARFASRTAGIALAAALAACRSERASVEELYTTRMVGLGYLQRNQLSEAESTFKRLTQLAPDDPVGHADLGLTYLQAGR